MEAQPHHDKSGGTQSPNWERKTAVRLFPVVVEKYGVVEVTLAGRPSLSPETINMQGYACRLASELLMDAGSIPASSTIFGFG